MLQLTVLRVSKDEAVCQYAYDKQFEDFYRKSRRVKNVQKRNVGKFIEHMFHAMFETTPKTSAKNKIKK